MGELHKSPLFQAVTVMSLKSFSAAFVSVINSSKFLLCVFTHSYSAFLFLVCSPGLFTHTPDFWSMDVIWSIPVICL